MPSIKTAILFRFRLKIVPKKELKPVNEHGSIQLIQSFIITQIMA